MVTRPTKPEGVRVQAKTMIGVAPAAPPPKPRLEMPSDFPAALGSLDPGADLPSVAGPSLPVVAAKKPPPPPTAAARPAAVPAKPASPALPAFGDIDADLPAALSNLPAVASAGLPATRSAAQKPAAPKPRSFEIDLPANVGADLPSAKRAPTRDYSDLPSVASDLPSVSAGLPAVSAGLPAVSAGLPAVAAGLPSVASNLPSNAAALPSRASDKGFGEIELPSAADAFGSAPRAQAGDHFGDFGELDLPRENAPQREVPGLDDPRAAASAVATQVSQPDPRTASRGPARAHTFGELDFDASPDAQRRAKSVPPPPDGGAPLDLGGIGFGERDLGAGDADAESIATEAPIPTAEPRVDPVAVEITPGLGGSGGFDASQPAASARLRERPVMAKKSRRGRNIALGLFVVALLGAAALELTPYGAGGRHAITDMVKANEYAARTSSAGGNARKSLGVDTYDEAKKAIDQIGAAHASAPRARPLTAYAAFVDFAVSARYGADAARAPRGKSWLLELPPNTDVQYLSAALAAQMAASDDVDKARKALDAVAKKEAHDPIEHDLQVLRGEVELRGRDGAAALGHFQKALLLDNDARSHFGLARAHALLGDAGSAKKEIDATLAASPSHVGAVVLRAQLADDDAAAAKDLAQVLEGPLKAKAAPAELADAYAIRGWTNLQRGGTTDARAAFEEAVKLNPRGLQALLGQGELLFREGRYTEALTRFSTALQAAPDSIDAIVSNAKTQIALERLADAKTQLTAARARFPKDMYVLMWLGKVESQLNNNAVAEQNLRGAIALSDPSKKNAVLPYVWLASLMQQQGKVAEAIALLGEAKKKLPDSAALQRALGEVSEAQSQFDEAVQHYKAAADKDPRDISTHFRLGATLRKMRRFDEAGAQLDKVQAYDKDYPGLAIERGQLYEESGDVTKAIDQFKAALAKAPDDPDLQLRVGAAYVAIKRPDDAIPVLMKVREKRGNSAEVHHYLGRAYMLKGRLMEALKELKRAVELDPNRAEFHVYVAWAANDITPPDLGAARDEVAKALALDKALAEGYWLKGVLECKQGGLDDGPKDLKKALDLKPTLVEAHAGLAQCDEQRNEPAMALVEWSKAVQGDSARPEWRFRYGKLLLDRGNAGAALPHLAFASEESQKLEAGGGTRPPWSAPAEFNYAEALRKSGKKADALVHYKRYKQVAPAGSSDLRDADKAIADLEGTR